MKKECDCHIHVSELPVQMKFKLFKNMNPIVATELDICLKRSLCVEQPSSKFTNKLDGTVHDSGHKVLIRQLVCSLFRPTVISRHPIAQTAFKASLKANLPVYHFKRIMNSRASRRKFVTSFVAKSAFAGCKYRFNLPYSPFRILFKLLYFLFFTFFHSITCWSRTNFPTVVRALPLPSCQKMSEFLWCC